MFSSWKLKIALGIYIFIAISIPLGSYLVARQTTLKSSASEPVTLPAASPATLGTTTSSASTLQQEVEKLLNQPSPTPEPSSTLATSFGPTLNLKVNLEGRTKDNQAGKLFVGIAEGTIYANPKFLLSFIVDLPASGSYSGLSLAGLNTGTRYTALLKGPHQIATASAFIMSPTVSTLNSGEPVNLLSGDLNDDNVINSADYTIAQRALGSGPSSFNWNEKADINGDGVVNSLDLSFITKNMGQTGVSGSWTSPLPAQSSPSADLNSSGPPTGGLPAPVESGPGGSGYWIFVPKQ